MSIFNNKQLPFTRLYPFTITTISHDAILTFKNGINFFKDETSKEKLIIYKKSKEKDNEVNKLVIEEENEEKNRNRNSIEKKDNRVIKKEESIYIKKEENRNNINSNELTVFTNYIYTACRNKCKHQNGTFRLLNKADLNISNDTEDIEDIIDSSIVVCTSHGWKLDTSTMEYVHPIHECIMQDELKVTELLNGDLEISEYRATFPWDIDVYDPNHMELIYENEFSINYLSHVTVELKCDGVSFITNPWLEGPAFGNAWWLNQSGTTNYYTKLADSNGIYISSSRSDFCHIHTLTKLASINPKVPIYVPKNTSKYSLQTRLTSLGFTNVIPCAFGYWIFINQNTRFMLLPNNLPETHSKDDSFMLFEYKGRRAVYLVHAEKPNCNYVPPCDIMITEYNIEPSAYPLCYLDNMGEVVIRQGLRDNAEQYLRQVASHISQSKAKVWIAMGAITEAYPGNVDLKSLIYRPNFKMAAMSMKGRYPSLNVPQLNVGDAYDVGTAKLTSRPLNLIDFTEFDFQKFNKFRNFNFMGAMYLSGLKYYFDWAEFPETEFILHIQECNDDFTRVLLEYLVDFPNRNVVIKTSEYKLESANILKMKVRSQSFQVVMQTGNLWHDMLNSWDTRIEKVPVGVQLAEFWSHVRFRLPLAPPNWDQYLANRDMKEKVLERGKVADLSDILPRVLIVSFVFLILCILFILYLIFKSK